MLRRNCHQRTMSTTEVRHGVWTADEHDRFLTAIAMYPTGPWRFVAAHVGTRNVRQVQTHAQKYHEKMLRHARGLRKTRRKTLRGEHRIDPLDPTLVAYTSDPEVRSCKSEPETADSSDDSESPRRPEEFPITTAPNGNPGHSSWPEDTSTTELPSIDESLDFLLDCVSSWDAAN